MTRALTQAAKRECLLHQTIKKWHALPSDPRWFVRFSMKAPPPQRAPLYESACLRFFLCLNQLLATYTLNVHSVCAAHTPPTSPSTGIKTSLRQHAFNRGDTSSAAHTNKNGEELHPASSCQTEAKAHHVCLYLKEEKQQRFFFPPIHCFCSG